jgi:undecaprenyl-diphosphatase
VAGGSGTLSEEVMREVADLPRRASRTGHGRARLVAAVVFAFLLWRLYAIIAQWGDRTWIFVSAAALVLALLLLLDWVLAALGPPAYRVIASALKSAVRGIAQDAEVQALASRHPRISGWLSRRTTLASWRGLPLTLTVAATAYFLVNFFSLALRTSGAGIIAGYDARLSALMRAFRTPDVTRVLWVFTVLGDPRVAFSLTALVVLLLVAWGRRPDAFLVAAAVVGGGLLGDLAKQLFRRARPDIGFALIGTPSSFSLPSGHALYAMLFWGAVCVVLVRAATTSFRRLAAVAVCATAVVLTGLSRVYLGVHWPSDVLAAWMLGLAWLSVCIGVYVMRERYGTPAVASRPLGATNVRSVVTVVAIVAAVVAVLAGAQADPLLKVAAAQPTARPWIIGVGPGGLPAPTPSQVLELPLVSENLNGALQEPIGLIYIGSEHSLARMFKQRGWSVADKPMPLSLLRAVVTAASDKPYPSAPVTPAFLNGHVQDLAFEKPDGRATVRRRHHSRWWNTDFTYRGLPVWVATASLDTSLEIGSAIPVPTHHISPDIDAEQAYVARELEAAGARYAGRVRVSPPTTGTNAAGDQWFTRGLATVLLGKD